MNTAKPIENNSILHEAAGNLAFLMCVIRCGEQLSPEEEANVRRIISELTPDSLKLRDIPKTVRSPLIISRMIAKCGPTDERLSLLRKHCAAFDAKYGDEMVLNLVHGLSQMFNESNDPEPHDTAMGYPEVK